MTAQPFVLVLMRATLGEPSGARQRQRPRVFRHALEEAPRFREAHTLLLEMESRSSKPKTDPPAGSKKKP